MSTTAKEDLLRFNVLLDAYGDAAMQYEALSYTEQSPAMTRAEYQRLQAERQDQLNDTRRALTDHVNALLVNAAAGKYADPDKVLTLSADGHSAVDLTIAPTRDVTKPGQKRDAVSLDELLSPGFIAPTGEGDE